MGRWLKRMGVGLGALAVSAVVAGTLFEAVGRSAARTRLAPSGRMVAIGHRRIHLDCRGSGGPIVVLQSGVDVSGSLSWAPVHDRLARFTRACAYDRAGVMWSDPAPLPSDAETVARDLKATLLAAGEKGPYVMVGHSLGGPYVMEFTREFPQDVAGVVFVDASHPDQLDRFEAAGLDAGRYPPFLVRVAARTTWLGWTRVPAIDLAPPGASLRVVTASRAFAATSVPEAVHEIEALTDILAQAGRLRTLDDRPLVVLTAAASPQAVSPGVDDRARREQERRAQVWRGLHDDEARWSGCSRHEIVPGARHYIQIDRPDVVVAAVADVVDRVRRQAC